MSDSAESFDLNNQSRAADAAAALPTSSSEVQVRTMASDFELMGRSGGMVDQAGPQSMHIPVTLHPETIIRPQPNPLNPHQEQPVVVPPEGPQPVRGGHLKIVLITTLVTLAIAGLLALGYFVVGR